MFDGRRESPASVGAGLRTLAVVEIGFFVLLWVAFGVSAFVWIRAHEIEHDRRVDLIRRGQVEPVTLRVLAAHRDDSRGTWLLELGTGELGVVERREAASVEDLPVGAAVEAYRFGGGYFVPHFYNDVRWGKYVFLAFGLLPLIAVGVARAVRTVGRAEPTAAPDTGRE